MCESQRKFLSWDRENYIFPKVTKMGLYIYMWPQNRIDYNGVGFWESSGMYAAKTQAPRPRGGAKVAWVTVSARQEDICKWNV